jgi:hypothetical protein
MTNQYLLKEKKFGAINILQERSTREEIYKFPENYLVIARGYTDKLRELDFLLQGNTYFMIHFTRQVPHQEIVFEDEKKWDQDGKGKQEVNVGVNPSVFNSLSEDEKLTFIVKIIARTLREYVKKYNGDAELVDKVESLILKHGLDLEIAYKTKETNKYKLIINYQIKRHDESNAIIEFQSKISNHEQKIHRPLRWYYDIDQLIENIKVKNDLLIIEFGNIKPLNDLLNQWDFLHVVDDTNIDEYSDLIDPILNNLKQGSDQKKLAEFIVDFVTKRYGDTPTKTYELAEKILQWWSKN